jgi:putative ATPase
MAALSVATAPKSNASYEGINAALAKVREGGIFPVPLHLRNAPTKLAKELGHGEGYRYPHAEENGFVAQEYLPERLGATDFYRPKLMGAEKVIGERMKWWEGLKQKEKGRY